MLDAPDESIEILLARRPAGSGESLSGSQGIAGGHNTIRPKLRA